MSLKTVQVDHHRFLLSLTYTAKFKMIHSIQKCLIQKLEIIDKSNCLFKRRFVCSTTTAITF